MQYDKLTFQSLLAQTDRRLNAYNMCLYCLIPLQDPQDENMSGIPLPQSIDM